MDMANKKDYCDIKLVAASDVIETVPNAFVVLNNVEPFIDKLFFRSVKIGKINAMKTRNNSIIFYHTPNARRNKDKEIYWDAVYQDVISKYTELYENCDLYMAWYLKRSNDEHIHAAIIVPMVDVLTWCGDLPTDIVRGQNKWSFTIHENLFDNSYEIKFSKRRPIDLSDYLNPFELFLDKTELEELIPKSGRNETIIDKPVVDEQFLEKKVGLTEVGLTEVGLTDIMMTFDTEMAPVICSCKDVNKKIIEIDSNIESIKNVITDIQDKIDGMTKELGSKKSLLEDEERKRDICVQDRDKCEKEIIGIMKKHHNTIIQYTRTRTDKK
jgi:hypothetical protein